MWKDIKSKLRSRALMKQILSTPMWHKFESGCKYKTHAYIICGHDTVIKVYNVIKILDEIWLA